jgi:hypothetical protein
MELIAVSLPLDDVALCCVCCPLPVELWSCNVVAAMGVLGILAEPLSEGLYVGPGNVCGCNGGVAYVCQKGSVNGSMVAHRWPFLGALSFSAYVVATISLPLFRQSEMCGYNVSES